MNKCGIYNFPVIDSNGYVYNTAQDFVGSNADGEARAERTKDGDWRIVVRRYSGEYLLGVGETEDEAWTNAVDKVLDYDDNLTIDDEETLRDMVAELDEDDEDYKFFKARFDALMAATA